jgi:thiol-disulfide isomerase/thioredoxin
MRLSLSVLIALLGVSAALSAATATSLDGPERAQKVGEGLVGSLAPKLVVRTIDGEQIDLGSLYGRKAVYLKFWATWCKPCREQMPHFEHIYQSAGSDLAVIAVDVGLNDTLDDVQGLRSKLGLTMPIVFDDGRLGEAFHLRVTPQHVIIGKDGRIQYVGWLADQRLEDALKSARTASGSSLSSRGATAAVNARHYDVGDRLPKMSARTLDGSAFDFQDSDAPMVLVFLNPWCEHEYLAKQRPELSERCRQVREQVDALSKQNRHVRWLGIASGIWTTQDDLVAYRDEYKPEIPLTLDETGTWFRSFQVMTAPTIVMVNRNGKIVRRTEGFDATLPEALRSTVGR